LAATDGFSQTDRMAEQRWRFYSQWDKQHHLRVQVAESHHLREELSGQIAMRLLVPILFGLPLLGLWMWFATQRGLAPIGAVTAAVAGRAPDRLDPLAPAAAPEELRPLIEAMNSLFARVARTLEDERRFTADASHELRTPLAALAMQAEVALRARDADERDKALEQILAGSRRASHLVDQLLTLARLDPAVKLALQPVRVDALAAEVCAGHGAAALEKHIALELDAPQDIVAAGDPGLLRILLRNLVDNALRYTPAGGRVVVQVAAAKDGVELVVCDSGPGIPAAERTNALRRFQRLAGQEIEGSGLGLSIVARIAELHGAHLELADNPAGTGLAVRIVLPAIRDNETDDRS
jgi:signal transduction histidine kinase